MPCQVSMMGWVVSGVGLGWVRLGPEIFGWVGFWKSDPWPTLGLTGLMTTVLRLLLLLLRKILSTILRNNRAIIIELILYCFRFTFFRESSQFKQVPRKEPFGIADREISFTGRKSNSWRKNSTYSIRLDTVYRLCRLGKSVENVVRWWRNWSS